MKIIDLFSGCGGLSLGFEKAGFEIDSAVEFDDRIAETYKKNHPSVNMIVDDVRHVDESNLLSNKRVDVIVGGPPCQGFSMAGARIRKGFIDDPRNYLFKHYFNIVKMVKPKVFLMENVKGITTMHNGKIFNEILSIFQDPSLLEGQPYSINYRIVKAIEFGIPQKRERLILLGTTIDNVDFNELWIGTREQILSEFPSYFDDVTVADAIGNLPHPTKDGIIKNPKPQTKYQEYLYSSSEFVANHQMTKHSKQSIDRMNRVHQGENYTVLQENITSIHSGSYGRLSWSDVSPTITTRFDTPAGGRFIHPDENRTLTPREAARIQSFPDDFIFYGSKSTICKTIGNAVPPKISYFLARLTQNLLLMEAN